MEDKKFDPRKFIDRDFEQSQFEDLLKFDDHTRILAICDDGGMGKTELLKKLYHRCVSVKPYTPVSLIDLSQEEFNNPLILVNQIAHELASRFQVQFPKFEELYFAQLSGDFDLIRSSSVHLDGSNFAGAQGFRIASKQTNIDNIGAVGAMFLGNSSDKKLSAEQQAIASRLCINAFFNDLKEHCNRGHEAKVVLLLDAFEKCQDELKEWIVGYLMANHFFNLEYRPARLVLVVAGRETPDFEMKWDMEDIKAIVKSRKLGKWEKEHVEKCLRVNGFIYEANHLELFWNMIQNGMPPSLVIEGMHSILRRQQ